MEIGVGLDQGLGLSWAQHRELAREAARLGYASVWTNAGIARDPFAVCAQWSLASAGVVPGGLRTGISVVPVPVYTAQGLGSLAATVGELTENRFVLGVGSGSIYSAPYRRMYGLPEVRPIRYMREWLTVLRRLLSGEKVDFEGTSINLHGVQLGVRGVQVPVVLGALGEQMLRLAGSASDGAALNWCNPEAVAWSREKVAEGARRAGRDPAEVQMIEYIRICVDDDEETARRGLARAILSYALARPGASKEHGYRGHFARMGFDAALSELEARRERGATDAEIAEAFPTELLQMVAYYGRPEGAAAAFRRLAEGLDVAIVRVVPARPGVDAVAAVMRACKPDLVRGA
jgi:alkanesulfonate monooxygenase SsuD/methylene tetrahydromethanopterin reductase-like flavin-dependent oxidoreductase (luciferase family)